MYKEDFNETLGSSIYLVSTFKQALRLLRDIADLQNGAPLEIYRQEWEQTMNEIYEFLNRWENK